MYSNILFIFFSFFLSFVSFCLFLTFLLCALLCYLLPIRHNITTTMVNRVLLRHRFTNISGWLRMRTWAGELLKLERGAPQQVWPLRRLCLRHHRRRRYFFTSFFATQRRPTPKPDRCVLLRHSPPYAMVTLARLFTLRSRRPLQCAHWSNELDSYMRATEPSVKHRVQLLCRRCTSKCLSRFVRLKK